MREQKAHMPACLVSAKVIHPKRESASMARARKALNASLEEVAQEVEALARNVPNWKVALSSAAARIRAKKLEAGEL